MYAINSFKPFIITLILNYNYLSANEIHWRHNNIIYSAVESSQPYIDIQRGIQIDIQRYLKLREPINIDSYIPKKIQRVAYPPQIPEPPLPHDIQLTKEIFETTGMFNKRVEKVKLHSQKSYEHTLNEYKKRLDNRQKAIQKIDDTFTQNISKRNQEIDEAKKIVEKDIKYLQLKYEKKIANLEKKLSGYSSKYFHTYLGNPKLQYIAYDADSATMQLLLTSSVSNFRQTVEINIEPSRAKEVYSHIDSMYVDIIYDIVLNQELSSIQLSYKKTLLTFNNHDYLAKASSENSLTQTKLVAHIKLSSPENIAKDFTPYKQHYTQREFTQPSMSKLEAKRYTINAFNGDKLLSKLSQQKTHIKDARKWLVVIGIEEYDMTDNITYANNSAKDFYTIMKKKYGVLDENSYLLLNKDASSGKISDLFKELSHHIKVNDTLYFYYNGHGVANPNENNRAYILPSDRRVEYIIADKRFSLKSIYSNLLLTKAAKIFVFADTCFSGSTDNQSIYKGVASARIVAKKEVVDSSRISIITAGRGTQFSNKYDKEAHRLMSYYLLDAILENQNTIFDIYTTMYKGVYKNSRQKGPIYTQEPQFFGNKNAIMD